jgi:hypothetical protein
LIFVIDKELQCPTHLLGESTSKPCLPQILGVGPPNPSAGLGFGPPILLIKKTQRGLELMLQN